MSTEVKPLRRDIDIDKPRWDQNEYSGRAKHFFTVVNPFNILTSNKELDRCREVVCSYKSGKPLPMCITEEELWKCKHLYDSAFHPDTGEKMHLVGRMSAQVPMNTLITGGMMAFYKSTPAVIFWQWFNQSFNALVNYTNRSGASTISEKQLLTSYVAATGGAVATALSLNHLAKKAPPLIARFVPFTAVAAANMVNIPLMRAQELKHGLLVSNDRGVPLGYSKVAAQKAIASTVISRILLALPPFLITAFALNYFEQRGTFCRYPWMPLPMACLLSGLTFLFVTPMALALFKQKSEIHVCQLERHLQVEHFVPLTKLELGEGLLVVDENDNPVGYSKTCARRAIITTLISRVVMATPSMILTPIIMNRLEKNGFLKRYPFANVPLTCLCCAVALTFATPMACALFKQKYELDIDQLEPELQAKIQKMPNPPKTVFYNKGL